MSLKKIISALKKVDENFSTIHGATVMIEYNLSKMQSAQTKEEVEKYAGLVLDDVELIRNSCHVSDMKIGEAVE